MTQPKRFNVATTPVDVAIEYSRRRFKRNHMNLDRRLPNFYDNYLFLQDMLQNALDIPRRSMPVIEPRDMALFEQKIKSGHIDIFRPYASTNIFPEELKVKDREKWLTLGLRDGSIQDDVLKSEIRMVPARDLLPLQSEIWLELLITYTIQYGVPKPGSTVTKTTIIISQEGYILDGHHRYGQVFLSSPDIEMRCLYIPLTIGMLLKMTRVYGTAIGNTPNL